MFLLGADGSPSAAEEVETAPAVGVHPHPSTLPEKKRVEDPAPRGAFSKAWAAIGVGYGDELEGEEELDEWPEEEEDEDEEDVLILSRRPWHAAIQSTTRTCCDLPLARAVRVGCQVGEGG